MKTRLLLLTLCVCSAANGADFATWTHRQTVTVTKPGHTRVDLEPALLDASRKNWPAAFNDLRIVSPTGVETPCIIVLPRTLRPELVDASGFKTTLNAAATVLEFRPPAGGVISEILLKTNAASFIKAAKLEASPDGAQWQTLASNALLCRQDGAESLRFGLAPAAWKNFRVTLDDARSRPVVFTGAQVRPDLPELHTLAQPVTIRARTETNKETRLKLDLGAANILLGNVRLHTPEAMFHRTATLETRHATIFRFQNEGRSTENLDMPVHRLVATREVELVIRNDDSPPLRIDRIEATRHPISAMFLADTAGEWKLYIGNAGATPPTYHDIVDFNDRLRDLDAHTATAGVVEANTAFSKAATAPDVGDVGPAIDVSAWAFQRPVMFKEAGVVVVELEPEVLARAANDLHDVRVVRDGHQIPYFAVKPGLQKEIDVPIEEVSDPKMPTWSKWEIRMPFANFPASELLLDSPTPLFMRTLTVSEQHETEHGHFERILSNANWQRQPGQPVNTFHLSLYSAPRAGSVRVATDNGDNPRLRITSARVNYPVVRLMFRVLDTAPVQVCYGNRRAPYTRYDLQFVRKEFENAAQVAATLGDEEKLPGYEADPRQPAGQGTPWIWAALALVVGALLWVVAKMLPKKMEG